MAVEGHGLPEIGADADHAAAKPLHKVAGRAADRFLLAFRLQHLADEVQEPGGLRPDLDVIGGGLALCRFDDGVGAGGVAPPDPLHVQLQVRPALDRLLQLALSPTQAVGGPVAAEDRDALAITLLDVANGFHVRSATVATDASPGPACAAAMAA